MKHLILLGMVCLSTPEAAQAAASTAGTPAAAVKALIDAFNQTDPKAGMAQAMAVLLPAGIAITDELPPYHWNGRNAMQDWFKDLLAYDKASGNEGGPFTPLAPERQEISGKHAYVVQPITWNLSIKGQKMREDARMTLALENTKAGWKIAAWTWSSAPPYAVK